MANTDVITEKVYCHDNCGGNWGGNWGGNDMAYWAMANNWNNNPFAYMMIMGMMRWMYGDNWNDRSRSDYGEINARFNQLQNQISDNHNTDIINEAVKGNTARIGELANNLNVDLRAIHGGLCDVKAGIQNVAGKVEFSAERVINAAQMGDLNIITALKDCCCQNKELVQRMGYENQLGQKDLQAALQAGHTALGFNMQQGFDRTNTGLERAAATVAFEAERNKSQIIEAIYASQQKTADLLNGHWKEELAKENQNLKFALSQKEQNEYLIDKLAQRFGCGCGCGCN